MKYIATTTFLIIIFLTPGFAQNHPLPLQVTSIQAYYLEDVLSEYEYETLPNGDQVPQIIGFRYEIVIDFKVEDPGYMLNQSFRIFASDWNDYVRWIDIDSSMIYSDCENCLSVSFNIDVEGPGWLDLYCFPRSFEFHSGSIWALKKGTDIQRSVYLR